MCSIHNISKMLIKANIEWSSANHKDWLQDQKIVLATLDNIHIYIHEWQSLGNIMDFIRKYTTHCVSVP